MQLSDIRTEVLNKGFDPTLFGTQRINNYINDAYLLICRRVQYYIDEASFAINTVQGTAIYALPTNFARVRELFDTVRLVRMMPVGLTDIDMSFSPGNGPPMYYALDAANIHLFPVPDAIYNLSLRYWLMPTPLAADTDVPTLPSDWHHLLWEYATWQCYESEDDPNMGQYWQKRFLDTLAMFTADQKFPSTDYPTLAKSMWDQDSPLQQRGWSLWNTW